MSESKKIIDRVAQLRSPATLHTIEMVNGINHSLASLSGFLISGKNEFKNERMNAWNNEIKPSLKFLEKVSVNAADPVKVERMKQIKTKLAELKKFQQEIEEISSSRDNLPANKILFKEAAPKANILLNNITRIINIETKLPATPERKALLGMMADIRETTARFLTNIRAYLLTGNRVFKARAPCGPKTSCALET